MMNTLGYLSTEKNRAHWSKAISDGYISVIAVGILSGIMVAYVRTPMHLPGHKAVFWMVPVLAARLITRTSAGASVGALATAATTLSLGGRIAGGIAMMPLVILAGVVLDITAQYVERNKFAWWKSLLILAMAGLVGNLICFIKRLFDPMGAFFSAGNVEDLFLAGALHAAFGLFAGLLGAAAGYLILESRKSPLKWNWKR
jgi:hypothetical protein